MATIEEALYSKLTATAGVTTLISTRIYPDGAAQVTDPAVSYLSYSRISGQPHHTMEPPAGLRWARMQYMAHAATFAAAKAISQAVLAALDGYKGTVGAVAIGSCLSEVDGVPDYDPETRQHLIVVDFMVHYA